MEIKLTDSQKELKIKFYSLQSFEDLANLLEVKPTYLNYLLYKIPLKDRYNKFELKKKSGGKRVIANPIPPIKIIQKKLLQVLEAVYEPRCSAFGFIKTRGIRENANRHSVHKDTKTHKKKLKLKFVLNIDIKDFFPSIHFGRVRGLFANLPYKLPLKVATWLAQICCYDYGLPQGAPTSPIISNMICNRLDSQLQRLAQHRRCTYTRYADDITFSTNISRFPTLIALRESDGSVLVGKELEEILTRNGFQINQAKVRLQTSTQRQEITGLIVNRFPNVRRTYIRELRAMLYSVVRYWEGERRYPSE
jgi:RNA-directed DNA polymerase